MSVCRYFLNFSYSSVCVSLPLPNSSTGYTSVPSLFISNLIFWPPQDVLGHFA